MNWHLKGVPAKMRDKCSRNREKVICSSTTMIPAEEAHSMSDTVTDFFDNNFPNKVSSDSFFLFLFYFGLQYFAFARHDSYARKCAYHK